MNPLYIGYFTCYWLYLTYTTLHYEIWFVLNIIHRQDVVRIIVKLIVIGVRDRETFLTQAVLYISNKLPDIILSHIILFVICVMCLTSTRCQYVYLCLYVYLTGHILVSSQHLQECEHLAGQVGHTHMSRQFTVHKPSKELGIWFSTKNLPYISSI